VYVDIQWRDHGWVRRKGLPGIAALAETIDVLKLAPTPTAMIPALHALQVQ
jgi:hypothetical protein